MYVHGYRSYREFLFIPIDVATIYKLVHVIKMFLDEPIVCGNQNKLSWTGYGVSGLGVGACGVGVGVKC